jgi:excisionase family DNA binding protein
MPHDDASPDQPMLNADAARVLRVAERTIRELHERGELSAQRTPGGIRVYRRADVEALARKRRR